MDSKHTMLLFRTADHETTVAHDTRVVLYNAATGLLDELWPGAAIPAVDNTPLHIYTVPTAPVEAIFAILDVISCTTHTGMPFKPGFSFSARLRYISPLGLRALLNACTVRKGSAPDCITLGDLYELLLPALKVACAKAAAQFSGGSVLPYSHWWQEMNGGSTFAKQLAAALVPVFNAHGFQLDMGSMQIKGLAGVPLG